MSTSVCEGGGKHAIFNELFTLLDIDDEIITKQRLLIEAYDKDILTSDRIGATLPISFVNLT